MAWLTINSGQTPAIQDAEYEQIKDVLKAAGSEVDSNGDGAVSREELEAAVERMLSQLRDPEHVRELLGRVFEPFNDEKLKFLATPVGDLSRDGGPFEVKLKSGGSASPGIGMLRWAAKGGMTIKARANWPEEAGEEPTNRTIVCAALHGDLEFTGAADFELPVTLNLNQTTNTSRSLEYYYAFEGNALGARVLGAAISHLRTSPFDLEALYGHLTSTQKLHAICFSRESGFSIDAKAKAVVPLGSHSVELAFDGAVVLGERTKTTLLRAKAEGGPAQIRLISKTVDSSDRQAGVAITFKVSLSQAANAVLGAANALAGAGVARFIRRLHDKGYLQPGTFARNELGTLAGQLLETHITSEALRSRLTAAFKTGSPRAALQGWLESEINDVADIWTKNPAAAISGRLKAALTSLGINAETAGQLASQAAEQVEGILKEKLKELARDLRLSGQDDADFTVMREELGKLGHDLKETAAEIDDTVEGVRSAVEQLFKVLDGVRKGAEAAVSDHLTISYVTRKRTETQTSIDANLLFDPRSEAAQGLFPDIMAGDRSALKNLIFGEAVDGVAVVEGSRLTRALNRERTSVMTVQVLGLSFLDAFKRDASVNVVAEPGGIVRVSGQQRLSRTVRVGGREQESFSIDVLALCAASHANLKTAPFRVGLTLSGVKLTRKDLRDYLSPFLLMGLDGGVERDSEEIILNWRNEDVRLNVEQIFDNAALQGIISTSSDKEAFYRRAADVIHDSDVFSINHRSRGRGSVAINTMLASPNDVDFNRQFNPTYRDARKNPGDLNYNNLVNNIRLARKAIVGVASALDVMARAYQSHNQPAPGLLDSDTVRQGEEQLKRWQDEIAKGVSPWLSPNFVFFNRWRPRDGVYGTFAPGAAHALMELLYDLPDVKPSLKLTLQRLRGDTPVEAVEF